MKMIFNYTKGIIFFSFGCIFLISICVFLIFFLKSGSDTTETNDSDSNVEINPEINSESLDTYVEEQETPTSIDKVRKFERLI
ncbi:hypothetical protein [Candidatus Phytoplasma fraxini]|uniref:Secreted protein n=1 Tax=Ash yellows phytoplasma TaxID=35780 RepID=A0ABZ2U7X8_ASHYP